MKNFFSGNRHLLFKLLVIACAMFAFGYALIPIYKAICEITGINVLAAGERTYQNTISNIDVKNTQVDTSREIVVEFDANSAGVWSFKPAVSSLSVHPGEMTSVLYKFRNTQNRSMKAQAIPSFAPKVAAAHFHKLECFCYEQYTLAPGEEKEWPVVFIVDSKLPKEVKTITLSYTFFEVGAPVPAAPK